MATALSAPPVNPKTSPIGGGFTFAAPMSVDIDLPGSPKRYYEYGPVRFKFMLDGKYEFFSVGAKGERANLSNEFKIDTTKRTASYKMGLKGKLGENIDAQAIGKLSKDSIENLGLAMKDPKKFGLGLLRYLDVVLGHNFGIKSDYLSFVGVGLAIDPDLCLFSVLVPLRLPVKFEHDGLQVSGKIVADLILKVGPSMELMKAMAKRFGPSTIAAWFRLLVMKANVQLPKAAAAAAAVVAEETTIAATIETAASWVGVYSLAVPISFALLDFSRYICSAARASGIKDAEKMVYAKYYVLTLYGLERTPEWSDRVKREAFQQAMEAINKHGKVAMQEFLEKKFMGGSRLADAQGENANRFQVRALAERVWLSVRF